MNISILFLIIIASDLFFDFFFSKTGRKIISIINSREINDEEYQRKKFILRTIGFVFWVSIYATIYYLFESLK